MIIRELLANTNSIAFNYEYLYIFPIFYYSITLIIGLLKITFEEILSTPYSRTIFKTNHQKYRIK